VDVRLDGRVALVTGGSRGIGRAVATELAASGAAVMIVSRKEHDLAAAAESMPGTVAWHVADVVDADAAALAVGATMTRFDRLDILVNNASTNPYFGPLTGIDAARAQRTMMANQWAPVAFIQAAWTAWMCEHGGRVINVASIGAGLPEPNIGWYNATKAATVQLTRQFAQELGPAVTVNAVSPGVIKTDLSRALWERGEERIAARVPAGRLGVPTDVAGAVVFLASDRAAYITGQNLVVDGGITLGAGVT
jgi:NAD(P)-dependent dehydrogenase (short-subunit alcohol dehydrogenase family)